MPTRTIDGLPVYDGEGTLALSITREDIRGARRSQPGQCAVARGLLRELDVIEVRVHLGRIYLRTTQDYWLRYFTPRSVRQEIVAFDRGGRFEPLNLNLRPPSASEKLGTTGRTGPKRTKTGKRRPYHTLTDVRERAPCA